MDTLAVVKETIMIKSIGENQQEIIDNILSLHCETEIELDPTYSKGGFYKNREKPRLRFDILDLPDCQIADCQSLPIEDGSISTMMFDPPFLATKGPSLEVNDDWNKINKRFGVFPTEKLLHTFYQKSLQEFHRILRKNGILIFKCQDKVSSGKQYLSHIFIINEAVRIGFYPKDLFILLAKNRLVADWQKNQKNARKFHSYFIVFQKTSKRIEYT